MADETPSRDAAPTLDDGRVRLRGLAEADLPALVEQSRDPASVRWTGVPTPYGLDDARRFLDLHRRAWAEGSGAYWAVTVAGGEDGPGLPFAGLIDLRHPPGPGPAWELGFGLHPQARGRGVMSAAVRLAAGWAFEHGAASLYWHTERGNVASWRVVWATGFTDHGLLPARVPVRGGGAADAWCASLLPGRPMRPAHPWLEAPVIVGDGIRLRPLRPGDTAIAEPYDHPPHHVPAGAVPTPETVEDWLLRRSEVMARGTSINWCIAEGETDEPLGEVLVFVHHGTLEPGGTAELGYLVKPSARGRRVAVRAARLAADHALAPTDAGGLGLRRLLAETASDNRASNRVLTAAGFTRWGEEAQADAPDGSVGPATHWERLG